MTSFTLLLKLNSILKSEEEMLKKVNEGIDDGYYSSVVDYDKYEKIRLGKLRALSFRNKITPKVLAFLPSPPLNGMHILHAEVTDVHTENGLTTVSFQMNQHTLVETAFCTDDGLCPGPYEAPKKYQVGQYIRLGRVETKVENIIKGAPYTNAPHLSQLLVMIKADIGQFSEEQDQ